MGGRARQRCMARRSDLLGAPASETLHIKPFARASNGAIERRAFA